MNPDTQPSEPEQANRTRRAEPITQHIAKNGTVSYWFQADVGTKPDGSRDRRRFTYRTKAEARREYRRITTEVAAGTYTRRTAITVDDGEPERPAESPEPPPLRGNRAQPAMMAVTRQPCRRQQVMRATNRRNLIKQRSRNRLRRRTPRRTARMQTQPLPCRSEFFSIRKKPAVS